MSIVLDPRGWRLIRLSPAVEVLIEPVTVSVPLLDPELMVDVPETSSNDRFVVSPAPV